MMIAYCGLSCERCPARLATLNNDDELRRKTAVQWSDLYRATIKAKDINCQGCKSDSTDLFAHCHVCRIRLCGQEKELDHCGQCEDYPCEILNEFLIIAPEAKAKLEELRRL